MTTAHAAELFAFPYHSCRNVSSPEDKEAGRRVYAGSAPGRAALGLEDNENVREYLVEAEGKKRKSPTDVHKAIRDTLDRDTSRFSILNGGIVIVARDAEVDDKKRQLTLLKPSIINGSQTQGELQRFFSKRAGDNDYIEPSIRFEIIVTHDDDLIAEISISRNFQNDVRPISITGRRGQLDELEQRMRAMFPDIRLRKSESEFVATDDILDSEKLIQVTFALLPVDMLREFGAQAAPESKVFSYSQKTRCLKLFQRLVQEREKHEDVYQCFLDLAPIAWQQYEKWKRHQGFIGTGIRSIERDKGKVTEVPDGIIFPIISALSVFVSQYGRHWVMNVPDKLKDDRLIRVADRAYKEIAGHNPQTMGKNKACYSAVIEVTETWLEAAA